MRGWFDSVIRTWMRACSGSGSQMYYTGAITCSCNGNAKRAVQHGDKISGGPGLLSWISRHRLLQGTEGLTAALLLPHDAAPFSGKTSGAGSGSRPFQTRSCRVAMSSLALCCCPCRLASEQLGDRQRDRNYIQLCAPAQTGDIAQRQTTHASVVVLAICWNRTRELEE